MSYLSQMVGLAVGLPVSRHRHCRGLRPDPRLRPAENVDPRQCLGRPDAHYPVAAAAALSADCAVFVQQGVRRICRLISRSPLEAFANSCRWGLSRLAKRSNAAGPTAVSCASSSHPFEEPDGVNQSVQMLAIFLIPAALCFAFGEVVSDRRQGRAILCLLFDFYGLRGGGDVGGDPRQSASADAGRRQQPEYGRRRESLRYSRQQSVRGDHHRRLLRRGQCHA